MSICRVWGSGCHQAKLICRLEGVGVVHVTKPYNSKEFEAEGVIKSCKFVWLGAAHVTTPFEFVGFGVADVTAP